MFIRMISVPISKMNCANDGATVELVARQNLASTPREYVVEGTWPDGRLAADAPPEARLLAGISKRLKEALVSTSLRQAATAADLSIGTLSNLTTGKSLCDVVTLARLERVTGASLWGSEHCSDSPPAAR